MLRLFFAVISLLIISDILNSQTPKTVVSDATSLLTCKAMFKYNHSGHTDQVVGVGFIPNQLHFISVSRNGEIISWPWGDLAARKYIKIFGREINAFAINPSGKEIAVSASNTSEILRIKYPDMTFDDNNIISLTAIKPIDIAYTNEGDIIVLCNSEIVRISASNKSVVWKNMLGENDNSPKMMLLNDRDKILTSQGICYKLWDIKSGKLCLERNIEGCENTSKLLYHPGNRSIYVGMPSNKILELSVEDLKITKTFSGGCKPLQISSGLLIALDDESRIIALNKSNDNSIPSDIFRISPIYDISCHAISPSGEHIIVGRNNGGVELYSLISGDKLADYFNPQISRLIFDKNCNILYGIGEMGSMSLFNADNCENILMCNKININNIKTWSLKFSLMVQMQSGKQYLLYQRNKESYGNMIMLDIPSYSLSDIQPDEMRSLYIMLSNNNEVIEMNEKGEKRVCGKLEKPIKKFIPGTPFNGKTLVMLDTGKCAILDCKQMQLQMFPISGLEQYVIAQIPNKTLKVACIYENLWESAVAIIDINEKDNVWNLSDIEVIGNPCSVSLNENADRLVFGTHKGEIQVWNVASRKLILKTHNKTSKVTTILFIDNNQFFAVYEDGTVALYKIES